MAITNLNFGARFAAAGDTVTGTLGIRKMYVKTTTAGSLTWKNSDDDVLCIMYGAANSMLDIDYPFGERTVSGLELDALPSGATVDVIYW